MVNPDGAKAEGKRRTVTAVPVLAAADQAASRSVLA